MLQKRSLQVKTNHISARSMETFRRLGLAEELRSGGLPPDHPHDCAYVEPILNAAAQAAARVSIAYGMEVTDEG